MKMLLIVFHQSIAEHIHALLKEYDINAFSELQNVAGRGETGPNTQFLLSPGANRMIFTAVSEKAAYRLTEGLTRFKTEQEASQRDTPCHVHVFAIACEQTL